MFLQVQGYVYHFNGRYDIFKDRRSKDQLWYLISICGIPVNVISGGTGVTFSLAQYTTPYTQRI